MNILSWSGPVCCEGQQLHHPRRERVARPQLQARYHGLAGHLLATEGGQAHKIFSIKFLKIFSLQDEAAFLLSRALPVCERLLRAGLDWDQAEWSTLIGRDIHIDTVL